MHAPDELDSMPFPERVRAVVRSIPEGRVTSYGAVAAMCGAPRAARGVGAVRNSLGPDEDVPWWRVVNRLGELSIPAVLGRRELQRTLLKAESVKFRRNGRVNLDLHGWWPDEDGEVD